ncbi:MULTISPECIES: TolC family protein [unclassified Undibacterium]|uniref:TolC family protein n=1 Tax=unclassified Undibacterium TaxID=2630295 RepID=UPI002AC8B848|nr:MULTISPECIES: TolC family protein [unclassified Undibacterium]MEB0213670.1 TolC family protein [Undibacterium sp. 5I2]MEB0137591.1 TolC family protein [Undibacterium sp. CCC2.1]MEB0170592.1 TolC family protein [Undibacterium sp. CCC1.1]MEB0174533.1 TolC family protein [Undibacterium sp. CCC3.4]WPX43836.1 TolC family protein [Undibacterium sp. CCC3.4]
MICINFVSLPSYAAESLVQAWDVALQRDHQLLASQYQEQAAADQVRAARANYLPKLSMETGYLRTQSEPAAKIDLPALAFLKGATLPFAQNSAYYGALNWSVPLLTSGKIAHGVAAAQAEAGASQAQVRQTRSELKLAVASAYLAVLRAEHGDSVARTYLAALQSHRHDAQELFEHGYVPRRDLLAAEVAAANARQMALQADNALTLARAAYNRWLGRAYAAPVDLQDISAAATSDSSLAPYLHSATEQRSELQQLDARSQAYREQAASVRAGYLPQIGLSGGYAKLDNRYLAQDKGWWLGVVLKWDLFDGGLIRAQASQLAAHAAAVQEMQRDTAERIALQVHQAWLQQQEAAARIQLVASAVAQAEEALQLAQERYRAGLAPASEVLDAVSSRLQACSNRDNALLDRELSRWQLLYAAGTL